MSEALLTDFRRFMCKRRDTGWDTQDTVKRPYSPVRTTFVEITSFRPSFLDPSSPGLTLTPMKCVQNKKLMIFRLDLLIY